MLIGLVRLAAGLGAVFTVGQGAVGLASLPVQDLGAINAYRTPPGFSYKDRWLPFRRRSWLRGDIGSGVSRSHGESCPNRPGTHSVGVEPSWRLQIMPRKAQSGSLEVDAPHVLESRKRLSPGLASSAAASCSGAGKPVIVPTGAVLVLGRESRSGCRTTSAPALPRYRPTPLPRGDQAVGRQRHRAAPSASSRLSALRDSNGALRDTRSPPLPQPGSSHPDGAPLNLQNFINLQSNCTCAVPWHRLPMAWRRSNLHRFHLVIKPDTISVVTAVVLVRVDISDLAHKRKRGRGGRMQIDTCPANFLHLSFLAVPCQIRPHLHPKRRKNTCEGT